MEGMISVDDDGKEATPSCPIWLLCAECLEEMLLESTRTGFTSTRGGSPQPHLVPETRGLDASVFDCARAPAMTVTNLLRMIHRSSPCEDEAYVTMIILVDRWCEAAGRAQIMSNGRMFSLVLTALILAVKGTAVEMMVSRAIHSLFPSVLWSKHEELLVQHLAGNARVTQDIIRSCAWFLITRNEETRVRNVSLMVTPHEGPAMPQYSTLLSPVTHVGKHSPTRRRSPVRMGRSCSPPIKSLQKTMMGTPSQKLGWSPPWRTESKPPQPEYVRGSASFNRLPPNSCTLPPPTKPVRPKLRKF